MTRRRPFTSRSTLGRAAAGGRWLLVGWFAALLLACQRPASSVDAGGVEHVAALAGLTDGGVLQTPAVAAPDDSGLRPPVARREVTRTTLHGDTLEDEYAWMREKGTAEIEALLRAENAYTAVQLAPLAPLEERLDAEFDARRPERVDSLPVRHGRYEYWRRDEREREYERYFRRPVGGGREELVLDVAALAPDASYVDLLALDVTPDGRRAAWAIDTTGDRTFTLHVTELPSRRQRPDALEHVTSFAWAADGQTLLYTTENALKRSAALWRYTLGSDGGVKVYDEVDEHHELAVERSRSERLLILDSASFTTSEAFVLDAAKPTSSLASVLGRKAGQRYAADHLGEQLFVLTDDQGPERRLVSVPLRAPRGAPKELVPRRPGVPLDGFDVLAQHLVVWERVDGRRRPRALTFATGAWQDFAPADGFVSPVENPEQRTTKYRYAVESPVQPEAIFERDLATGVTKKLWQAPVPGFDPSGFELLRLEATAADGVKVPVTLARKKGLTLPAPLLLEGYGAYGDSLEPGFSQWAVSLLARGVVLGFAHVRGGGEHGEAWHDSGRREFKANSFSDFIAVAEFLQAQGHTTRAQLIITGGSAGGLLMGGVLNQRPELFRAALVEVPFVDVMNTMLDTSLPLTIGEFDEWGDPREPAAWKRMRAYSPYDNVRAQAYPPLLVRGAYHDTQVLFHEPTKWVQRLRARKTDPNPVLLWMSMEPSGHGGRTSQSDAAADELRRQAWLLSQWGLAE